MENFQLYRWQSHSTIRKALVQQQQQQTSQWVLTLVPINLVSTRKTKSRCPTLLCIFTLCHSWPGCCFILSTGLNFSPDLYIKVMAQFVFVMFTASVLQLLWISHWRSPSYSVLILDITVSLWEISQFVFIIQLQIHFKYNHNQHLKYHNCCTIRSPPSIFF